AASLHPSLYGQVCPHARTLVTQSINEGKLVTLRGNTRPEANAANDRGPVSNSYQISHMFLQLRRAPEQQERLEKFIAELHDPASSNFHKWLTGKQFGLQFGLAQDDLAVVTGWLESHGMKVNSVSPNLVVDFSGTAGQVRVAFHTSIHQLAVGAKRHYGNMSDPQIPAGLQPLVTGVVSLHDFMPKPLSHPTPAYTISSSSQALVPADIATIYNLNPAFAAGVSGQGQTIVLLENANLYSSGDWLVFRKVFGMARPYPQGKLITVHPGANCFDPGLNGDAAEATLDAEWATAAAPNATIEIASCLDTFTFGGFIALQNLLSSDAAPPPIVSIGFGEPESLLGTAKNAFINGLYQMAAAEGVSIFVSSGDSGAAFLDRNQTNATRGISVNGYSSTPYNVSVGGTDFADTYFGTTTKYWNANNSPTFGSARSYIPEIPWNDSCAGELLAISSGFNTPYGTTGYCNNGGPISIVAGGGGPSACATGSPNAGGVVGNTCQGYAKPAWQSILGNPNDGVRDIPDVSLFASNGIWGHYYVVCFSDPAQGQVPCLGPPNTWAGFGGTSFSAPVMAGIQALVNQRTGSRWGNPNPIYYRLAAAEYGNTGSSSCNSTGSAVNSSCTFYDVTLGDTAVNCSGPNNCFLGPSPGSFGVLSTSKTAYQPAYRANTGWDFATGIGSVNAWNLMKNWPAATGTASAGGITE
ncbi:MAG TPA: S53 family peptidase, partial [Bryobacteraceae bacterium]